MTYGETDSPRIWWHICIFFNAQTNAKKIQKSHQANAPSQRTETTDNDLTYFDRKRTTIA